MPTIITRGLGYDNPTIIYRQIGDAFSASLVVEDRLRGTLEVEEPPIARLTSPIPISGSIVEEQIVVAVLNSQDSFIGFISEDGCMATQERIQMFLRDDRTLSLTVNNQDNTPVDLTGSKVYFTLKERTSDSDAAALIKKRNTAAGGGDTEIKIIDASGGKAEIYIVPADTDGMNPGNYVWDVQITLANNKTYTVLRGTATFKEDVTKEQ